MPQADWQTWAAIAQVVATLLTGIGVIVSLWIGIRTLREARADRLFRVQPKLLFDQGGRVVVCRLKEAAGIPGVDLGYAMELLRSKPPGARHCLASHLWGGLSNHGNGAALNAAITVIARKVEKAGEEFTIDSKKLLEFPYSPALNHIPAMPSHIGPGKSAQFFRLPTPVTIDFTGQLKAMTGVVVIQYEDMYGNQYETSQELRVTVERDEDSAKVWLTFGEEIPWPKAAVC